jgi:hypothetical protein
MPAFDRTSGEINRSATRALAVLDDRGPRVRQ